MVGVLTINKEQGAKKNEGLTLFPVICYFFFSLRRR